MMIKQTNILVTAKVTPDLDGTACTLAYADFLNREGEKAEGLIFGNLQPETLYFVEKHRIQIPTADDNGKGDWSSFVLVDASSMRGMPKVVKGENVIEIIDHRERDPEEDFPHAKIQNEMVGAAATLVVERFQKAGKRPQPGHAKLLFGAIYHNTGFFKTPNTTPRDHATATFLEESFGFSPSIGQEMFAYADQKILSDLYRAILGDAKSYGRKSRVSFYQLVMWDSALAESRKSEIEEAMARVDKEVGGVWSFLNLGDYSRGRSLFYAPGKEAQRFFRQALGSDLRFERGWVTIPRIVLRKWLAPKLEEFLQKSKDA